MDLRQWCLEFGIPQEFDADDAIELIKAYESLYVPIHGRTSIEQSLQPDSGQTRRRLSKCYTDTTQETINRFLRSAK